MKSFTLVIIHLFLPAVDVVFECVAGRWGPQCTKSCGNCEGGPEFCQVYDGLCMNGCARGYRGVYCKERCPSGKRGQYCKYDCGKCIGSSPCNTETGKCDTGCVTGYQEPYCYMPCEFDRWGDGCSKPCQCTDVSTSINCGCHFETGICLPCGQGNRYYKEKSECLNENIFTGLGEYEPPDVLDIPYKQILAGIGTVLLFVVGNFLWWWFLVRNPELVTEPVIIQREKKIPRHLKKKIQYKSTLADILRSKLTKNKEPGHYRKKSFFLS